MKVKDDKYNHYVEILREELVPAMGCTEPIALAYCAAKAFGTLTEDKRDTGWEEIDKVEVNVSGNIIKNVKSVIVPNTNGLKGVEAAVSAGIISRRWDRQLEVLEGLSTEQKENIRQLLEQNIITVRPAQNERIFYIEVVIFTKKGSKAAVEICDYHTNITKVEKDGIELFRAGEHKKNSVGFTDRSILSVEEIVTFADIVDMEDIAEILDRQIAYNSAIAEEGMTGNWGANVGKTIRNAYGTDVKILAKAYAAAGSDARMSGCEMPVIIVSGSGNQGITASVPVIIYAREMGIGRERLLRALVVSNLITIHQKTGIGRLSAFCGAVSAGCGAGAGIAYLRGGDYRVIAHTIVNALAVISGMVCDGAKPSCAAKIAAAVDAGILGFEMFQQGQEFRGGDGIITKGVDKTIANVGRMAKDGMKETDKEIIKIMCDM